MANEKPQIIRTIDSLILPIKLYLSWQVPFMAKFYPTLLFLFYALLPTDFIADFIPLFGIVDDTAVLTMCAYLLVQLTPSDILLKFRPEEKTDKTDQKIIDISADKK